MTSLDDLTPAPVELRVTRWKCPFCARSWSRKGRTVEHAELCWKNPAARSCGTCRNYDDGSLGGWEEPGCPPSCAAGCDVWVTPDGFTDLNVHPRLCDKWAASDG